MKQEKKASNGSEKNELVKTSPKNESLAEMIVRTAQPVDLSKFRITAEDQHKIRTFVETVVREQFEKHADLPRALFALKQKEFKGHISGFIMDHFDGNEILGKQVRKYANEWASRWVDFYKYSELRATWTQSYLEFKQSFR